MSEFATLRAYLDAQAPALAAASGQPERFLAELDALRQYWDQDDDDQARRDETEAVLRRYPGAWAVLAQQGLVAGQPVPPQSPPAPAPAAPAAPSSPPDGEHTVANEAISPTTAERLAIWDKRVAVGKEILTGCLGLLIVGMTLAVALAALVLAVFKPDAWDMAQEVLLVLTGLVGVVLGYYFGRVPADARTDKAEAQAKTAQTVLDSTKAEVRGILRSAGASSTRSGDAPASVQLTADQRARLEQLLGP